MNATTAATATAVNSTADAMAMAAAPPPEWQHAVGIVLALASGVLIGGSVVFTKRGLQNTRSHEAGREHAYLRNGLWWVGMVMMGLGEVANFGAYAFAPAIMVAPLGAVSVVISAVLSSIFLKEYLSFPAKIGCAQCIIGSVIIVLHAPSQTSTQTIPEFFSYVLAPGFLAYTTVIVGILLLLLLRLAPRYGAKTPMVYIAISSIIGSYLVLSTQGFGSSLVYSIRNTDDNQFRLWPIYPLFVFIVLTIITQIHFLNRALALFTASVVTPIYYVCFTTATLVASATLFRGFPVDSPLAGVSIVMGFVVIVGGVALLFQFSVQELKASIIPAPPPKNADGGETTTTRVEDQESPRHRPSPSASSSSSSATLTMVTAAPDLPTTTTTTMTQVVQPPKPTPFTAFFFIDPAPQPPAASRTEDDTDEEALLQQKPLPPPPAVRPSVETGASTAGRQEEEVSIVVVG